VVSRKCDPSHIARRRKLPGFWKSVRIDEMTASGTKRKRFRVHQTSERFNISSVIPSQTNGGIIAAMN
jgi:hypothetical protein